MHPECGQRSQEADLVGDQHADRGTDGERNHGRPVGGPTVCRRCRRAPTGRRAPAREHRLDPSHRLRRGRRKQPESEQTPTHRDPRTASRRRSKAGREPSGEVALTAEVTPASPIAPAATAVTMDISSCPPAASAWPTPLSR